MSRRAVLTAIVIVTTGIIFGTVFVTGFNGLNLSFADGNTRFNTAPLYNPSDAVINLNETFTSVSQVVTPTVVSITVTSKATNSQQYHFWPFPMNPPEGQEEQYQKGSGSGIILTADGYILTNKHVVEGAKDDGIKVTLHDSREFQAKLIGADGNTDIAVVKIDAKDLSPASIGNSDEVKVGEWVLAVGNPLGLTSTVTAGIVSAISRNIGIINSRNEDRTGIENFIQTDAAINPGNSGGALVNLKGQVIGVNTAIATETGRYIGYGFAVPINLARVVANAIIKDGKFTRGYIGVSITSLDAKTAKGLGIDRYQGVVVQSLVEDGAGKAAGVKEGDVIVEVDGKVVTSSNELQARVGMHHPGETVNLKIFRADKSGGKYIDIPVKLKPRGNETVASNDGEGDTDTDRDDADTRSSLTFDKAGFTVKPLDKALKDRFDRETGVYVSSVKQYSPAFENNLRQDVIIFEARMGGTITKIESMSDLKKVLKSLGQGDVVLLRIALANKQTAFVPIEGPVM
jgi:serine protease Do